MGLSLRPSRQLPEAERTLRQAVASPKADAKMRGDLALVLGLEGKFAEAERVGVTGPLARGRARQCRNVRRMLAAGNSREIDRPAGEFAECGEGQG